MCDFAPGLVNQARQKTLTKNTVFGEHIFITCHIYVHIISVYIKYQGAEDDAHIRQKVAYRIRQRVTRGFTEKIRTAEQLPGNTFIRHVCARNVTSLLVIN